MCTWWLISLQERFMVNAIVSSFGLSCYSPPYLPHSLLLLPPEQWNFRIINRRRHPSSDTLRTNNESSSSAMSSKATPFFNRLDAVLESGMEHTVGKMEIFVQKSYQKNWLGKVVFEMVSGLSACNGWIRSKLYTKTPKWIVVFFDLSSPFFNRVDKFLTWSMEPGEWFITLSQTDKTTSVKLTITFPMRHRPQHYINV